MNYFLMDTILVTASGSIDINTGAGVAEVYSTGTALTGYAGMMIRALDTGGKRCWGILTAVQGPTGANWVSVASMPGYEDDTFHEVETGFTEGNLTSLCVMITDRPYREMQGTVIKETIRSPFSGGYVQSRPRFTRGRETFPLEWRVQGEAAFSAFKEDFLAYQGSMFFLTHPVTHLVMVCTFGDDQYQWKPLGPDVYSMTCQFEEL